MKYYVDDEGEVVDEDYMWECGGCITFEEMGFKEYSGIVLRVHSIQEWYNSSTAFELLAKLAEGTKKRDYCYQFVTPQAFKKAVYNWTIAPDHTIMKIDSIDQLKEMGEKYYFHAGEKSQKRYSSIAELMNAENKRREENLMSQVSRVFLSRGKVYGELELSNPIHIGYYRKGKYTLVNY